MGKKMLLVFERILEISKLRIWMAMIFIYELSMPAMDGSTFFTTTKST